jgi:hypothetical protein
MRGKLGPHDTGQHPHHPGRAPRRGGGVALAQADARSAAPGDEPERFFDVLRAMLFYIDEFPERLHHPKESDLLFPKLARRVPR